MTAANLCNRALKAYFYDNQDIGQPEVLAQVAGEAGLDPQAAHEVAASGRYADEVRADEEKWRALGISSVPSIVINDKYLVSGGQPPEVFEQTLRSVLAQEETPAA
ncbi:DsbA family oxidoreductase [Xenophilus azovorans]|uniref:DsbA family oxidoreductase n=1 Tax=Xenophilus azovorans TaxID=151755 RepID=UPI000A043129|nr:DsbA family protein [Xenophilus azovorans]